MRILTGLIATGLAAATVAGCTGETGYPASYGYPSTAYNRAPVYYTTNTAYNRAPAYATPYYGTPYAATTPSRYGPNGDYDRDGIPNRRDRDANGDGIPDRYQR